MYGCQSWTIKKAEHQRIDAFKLWCWRRLLRVSLDCKEVKPVKCKGNQFWIVTGRTDGEALRLWSPDVKNWLLRKDSDARKDWRQEEKGMTEDWMASPTWWAWVWKSSGHWWWTGKHGMLQPMGSQTVRHKWAAKLNWQIYSKDVWNEKRFH